MGKYHLIGIKGTGMSALAISLKQLGHIISGSDVEEDFFTKEGLDANGIEVKQFNANNISNDYVYIISSAYDDENEEVKEVLEHGYKYYYYHEFMKEFYKGIIIGVSGTHGKTTTTLMLTNLMSEYPVSAVIGDGTGIGNPDYKYFVFESCEYRNHFLNFAYDYLIINNIDFDHPDFFSNLNDVKSSFSEAAKLAKVLVINGDDDNCKDIDHPQKYTFGLSPSNYLNCEILKTFRSGYSLVVNVGNKSYEYFLPQLGKHMIYNFLAALTVFHLIGGDMENAGKDLLKYNKPKRRMEEYTFLTNVIIDDYAHHPKEIVSCLETIKLKYPNKKITVIFEPHTYSRTLALANEFNNAFVGVDELFLANTFTSKREAYNLKKEKLVRKIFTNAKRFKLRHLVKFKKYRNSVIVFMGAGNIRKYIPQIIMKNA
mgnify:CR=1 FL=1